MFNNQINSFFIFQTYTIVNESRHLLVFGVPRINLYQEVKHLFAKYGRLSATNLITDTLNVNKSGKFSRFLHCIQFNLLIKFFCFSVEIEQFTDCYYVAYEKLHNARTAKAMIDRKNFYGGNLTCTHNCINQ